VIVVDVGCQPHGEEASVPKLIDRFGPEILFGFDPWPWMEEGIERIGDTIVVRRRAAAWSHAGVVGIKVDGICTGIQTEERLPFDAAFIAEAFDFSGWLRACPPDEVVLKIDAEGAEYPLLAEIHASGLDERLKLVLVEWHSEEMAHGLYAPRPELRCPVEEWVS
jgi:hypothetical protein